MACNHNHTLIHRLGLSVSVEVSVEVAVSDRPKAGNLNWHLVGKLVVWTRFHNLDKTFPAIDGQPKVAAQVLIPLEVPLKTPFSQILLLLFHALFL